TKVPPPTMRKVLRPRGPIVRSAPQPAIATAAALLPPPSAMATVESLAESVFASRPDLKARVRTLGSTPETMNVVAPRAGFVWAFTVQGEGGPWLPGPGERQRAGEVWTAYNPAYLSFQATANAHEARLPRPADVQFNSLFTLGGLTSPLLAQLDPGVT